MQLCEQLGGMTLAEMDERMGAGELALWMAKAQIDGFVRKRMESHKLSYEQALDHARADHRAVVARRKRILGTD